MNKVLSRLRRLWSAKTCLVLVTLFFTLPWLLAQTGNAFYSMGFYSGAEFVAKIEHSVSWYDRSVAQYNQGNAQYARGNTTAALQSFQAVSEAATPGSDVACKARYNGALTAASLGNEAVAGNPAAAKLHYLEGLHLLLSYCSDNPTHSSRYESLEAYLRTQLEQLQADTTAREPSPETRQTQQPTDESTKALSDEKIQQYKHQLNRTQGGTGGILRSEGVVQQDW